jgi:uncharacterized protein
VNFEQNLKDRKLGHEWYGWDGNVDAHEAFIREPKRLFMAMLFFTFFTGFALACLLVWGFYPRLEPLNLGTAALALVGSAAAVFLALYGMLSFTLVTGIPLRLSEAIAHHLFRVYPAIALISDRLGISKDRLGYSLLEIHNELTRVSLRKFSNGRILCLAPRCLDRENVEQIRSLAAEYDCDFYMAPTGAQARQRIVQEKPAAIIGIACERDLVSGIRDVGYRIPVMAIANKRPAGPCKGAFIDLNELRESIETLKTRFDMAARAPAEEPSIAAQTH